MSQPIDIRAIRDRLATVTREEANMGSVEDCRVLDYYNSSTRGLRNIAPSVTTDDGPERASPAGCLNL